MRGFARWAVYAGQFSWCSALSYFFEYFRILFKIIGSHYGFIFEFESKKKTKNKNDLLFLNTQVFNSLFKNPFKITTGFEWINKLHQTPMLSLKAESYSEPSVISLFDVLDNTWTHNGASKVRYLRSQSMRCLVMMGISSWMRWSCEQWAYTSQ